MQLKGYDEKFQKEKTEVVKILQSLQLAGISGKEIKDFTWHHKYPHSKLASTSIANLKDSRSYIALGPNPSIRLDDPGSEGVDFNYKPHNETGDKEAQEPLTPRLSRNLKAQHERSGFDQLTGGICGNPLLRNPPDELSMAARGENLGINDVISEWSQWFIPEEEIKNIITNVSIKNIDTKKLESALGPDLGAEKDIYVESIRILTQKLTDLLHDYIILTLAKKGDKGFQEIHEQGIPVTSLTPENLAPWHSILNEILSNTPKWLKRGSMGDAINEERKRLSLLNQSKYNSENVDKIARKFDDKEAVKLIETTKITPDINEKASNIFKKFGLQDEFTQPLISPADLDKLIAEFESASKKEGSGEVFQILLKKIEVLSKSEDNLELLKWCAEYLNDELVEDETQGPTVQDLKSFLIAYQEKKKQIRKQQVRTLEKQVREQPSRGKKKPQRANKNQKSASKKQKPAKSTSPPPEATETFAPEVVADEYLKVTKLFKPEKQEDKEEWEKIPQLLQSHGNDPLSITKQTVLSLIPDNEEEEEENEEEENEQSESWYPNKKHPFNLSAYQPFFDALNGTSDSYQVFTNQQELGNYDLVNDFAQAGMNPNVIAMLALKAYMLDFFIHIPTKEIQNEETQIQLAEKIVEDIKKKLTGLRKKWQEQLENLRDKVNKDYLKRKIRDYMYEITPKKDEQEADWKKRLQDEVCDRILQDLNDTNDAETKMPAKPQSSSRSELKAFLDEQLPPLIGELAQHEEKLEDVKKHLENYVDPETKTFNDLLWNDVKAQVLARVDASTRHLYEEEAKRMSLGPVELTKATGEAPKVPPLKIPDATKLDKPYQNSDHLAVLLNQGENPGGGDCLFYALSESVDERDAMAVRQEIAGATINTGNHELMTILNETPGLSRYAYRVPANPQQGFNAIDVYRRILREPHTWGGRTEIATFARIRHRRVAVVEVERGVIESVRVYHEAGTLPEILAPNDAQLREAFHESLILIHRGGNHWVRGIPK